MWIRKNWYWIQSEFAKMLLNSEWIREEDPKFKEDMLYRWWIEIEFVTIMLNSYWACEKDWEFNGNSRKKIVNSIWIRKNWYLIQCEFAKK